MVHRSIGAGRTNRGQARPSACRADDAAAEVLPKPQSFGFVLGCSPVY